MIEVLELSTDAEENGRTIQPRSTKPSKPRIRLTKGQNPKERIYNGILSNLAKRHLAPSYPSYKNFPAMAISRSVPTISRSVPTLSGCTVYFITCCLFREKNA